MILEFMPYRACDNVSPWPRPPGKGVEPADGNSRPQTASRERARGSVLASSSPASLSLPSLTIPPPPP